MTNYVPLYTVIFKLLEWSVCDFHIFLICYVGKHACYTCWQYQPFWIVSLFLTYKNVSHSLVCISIFLLFEKMDRRNNIQFCVKNEIKCAKTFEMFTVTFGESTMSRTQIQFWYNRFKESRENINHIACPGRPSTSTTIENIEAVRKMILDNTESLLERLLMLFVVGISFGSWQAIFTDVLDMK